MFCEYYQAIISKSDALFIVAILKSFDHLAFDRALSAELFEFFVPIEQESIFLNLMSYLQKEGKVKKLEKKKNRLKEQDL